MPKFAARRPLSARARIALATGSIAVFALTGCTQTITMRPAPDSNNPLCAEVMVRLPKFISNVGGETPTTGGEGFERELDRIWTDAQATAAWGKDGVVTLVCGVPEAGPVGLSCINWAGVDWLVDGSDPARNRMITYGRNPAIQVEFDPTKTHGSAVWDALAPYIKEIPQHKACVFDDDEESTQGES